MSEIAEALEDVCRQHCYTDHNLRQYQGVSEQHVTDSGGLSTEAAALRLLASLGRFRIVREHGRMVVGYWPENDPEKSHGA